MRLSNPIPQPKRPKGTAQAEREAKRRARAAEERRENAKVKERSRGMCEMRLDAEYPIRPWLGCQHRATEIHHMIGGRGRSRIEASASAEYKQHLCREHHQGITGEIGGKRYERVGGPVPHWTDCYRRLR